MDNLTNTDPTGVLSAATAAVRLVGTVVQVAPSIKNAANRARGIEGEASLERDVAGITSAGVSPAALAAATRIEDEAERRAYEKLNMVLKTLGERVIKSGLVDIHKLAMALTQATAHIEVKLFSTETNKLFQSLAQKLNDANLVNSVFTSIYFIGFLTAELTSSLPGWKDTYHPLSQRIIQQLFKVALGMDGFKENLGANLAAYKNLAITAGLLRPTDIEYKIFRDFPSFSPCRYSSKSFTDKMNNQSIYNKLVRHFEDHGFPQPWLGRDVGLIKDWRFLSGDANSRAFEVEKADKHIGENFGKVLYWLICSANRMPAGIAVIAYFDQHIQFVKWLGPRFGYRVISAATDLNMGGPHAQMPRKLKQVFDTWVILMPSVTMLEQRQKEQQEQLQKEQNALLLQVQSVQQAGAQSAGAGPGRMPTQPSAVSAPQPAVSIPSVPSPPAVLPAGAVPPGATRPSIPSPTHPSQLTAAARMSMYQQVAASSSKPAQSPSIAASTPLQTPPAPAPTPASGTQQIPQRVPINNVPTYIAQSAVPTSTSVTGQRPQHAQQANTTSHLHAAQVASNQQQSPQIANTEGTQQSSSPTTPSTIYPDHRHSSIAAPGSPASSIASMKQHHSAGTGDAQSIASRPSAGPPSRQSSSASLPHGVPQRKPSTSSIPPVSQLTSPTASELPSATHRLSQLSLSSTHPQHIPHRYPSESYSTISELPSEGPIELPGSMVQASHSQSHVPFHLQHSNTVPLAPQTPPVASPSSISPSSAASVPVNSFNAPAKPPPAVKRRKAPPPPRVVLARALYDFEPEGDDEEEFPFRAGDVLEIVEKNKVLAEDGWCRARFKGSMRIGIAPMEYLEELPGQAPAPRPASMASPAGSGAVAGVAPTTDQQSQTRPPAHQGSSPSIHYQHQTESYSTTNQLDNQNTSTTNTTHNAQNRINFQYSPQTTNNSSSTSFNQHNTASHSSHGQPSLSSPSVSPPPYGSQAIARPPSGLYGQQGQQPNPQQPQGYGYGSQAGPMRPEPYQIMGGPEAGLHSGQIDPNMKLAARAQVVSAALPAVATLGAAAMAMSGKNGESNQQARPQQQPTQTTENTTINNYNTTNTENNAQSNSQAYTDNSTVAQGQGQPQEPYYQSQAQAEGQTYFEPYGGQQSLDNQAYADSAAIGTPTYFAPIPSTQPTDMGATAAADPTTSTQYTLPVTDPVTTSTSFDPASTNTGGTTNTDPTTGVNSTYDSAPTDVGAITNTDPTTGITSTYGNAPTTDPGYFASADTGVITNTDPNTGITSTYGIAPADTSFAANTDPTSGITSPYSTTIDPAYTSADTGYLTNTDPTTGITSSYPLSPLDSTSATTGVDPAVSPFASLSSPAALDPSAGATDPTMVSPLASLAPAPTQDTGYFTGADTSTVDPALAEGVVSPFAGMASSQSMMMSDTAGAGTGTAMTDASAVGLAGDPSAMAGEDLGGLAEVVSGGGSSLSAMLEQGTAGLSGLSGMFQGVNLDSFAGAGEF